MSELWHLFWSFSKIGLFTFGGGYAMLPMLQKEIVEKHHWATEKEIMDYFAISQCTPGVIAVNTATFIGYKQKKLLGGIIATLGIIFPSIVIITLIAGFLAQFNELAFVQHAFSGIRIVVGVLVVNVVIKMFKTAVIDWFSLLLFIFALIIGFLLNLSPIYIVFTGALLGIIFQKNRRL